MFKLIKNRRALIALFMATIAISSIVIYANLDSIVSHFGTVFAVVSMVIGILGWVKDKPAVFMFFAQCKALIFSGQTRWNLSAHYIIDRDSFANFTEIKKYLKNLGTNRQIYQETEHSLRMSIDGLNLQISTSEVVSPFAENERNELHIQVFEYHAPYHETLDLMKETFVPLFESIEKAFHIHKRNYAVSMFFGKTNPFYGLYFKHVELDKVLDFHCVVEENRESSNGAKCIVTIAKDRLDFSSASLNQLQNSAEKYLAVSWG